MCVSYSDNGMLVMPGVKYAMTFTSWDKFTVDDFKNNIKTRYVNHNIILILQIYFY